MNEKSETSSGLRQPNSNAYASSEAWDTPESLTKEALKALASMRLVTMLLSCTAEATCFFVFGWFGLVPLFCLCFVACLHPSLTGAQRTDSSPASKKNHSLQRLLVVVVFLVVLGFLLVFWFLLGLVWFPS